MGKRKSYCGKCTKLVKAEGIYCEGSCKSWYRPECVSLDASEYDRGHSMSNQRKKILTPIDLNETWFLYSVC